MDQVVIGLFGATAIWLSQQHRAHLKKWACICGLITQPAWYYASYKAEQWGIFAVSFLYTYSWTVGVWNHFVRADGQV